MIFLQNNELRLSILDPATDQHRFGSRYCTGGYIWQIEDLILGNLLSGPQYPDPDPTKFDGQGAPEVFETAPGHDSCNVNEELLVIGVGLVRRTSDVYPFHVRNNPEVVKFCHWNVHSDELSVSMDTSQVYKQFSLHLKREILLLTRTVISRSTLTNTGSVPVPLRWFSHPFFPHTKDFKCCHFSKAVTVPENEGFFQDTSDDLCMRKEYNWKKGCYRPLQMQWGESFTIKQYHDLTGTVKVKLGFPCASMPVWANGATFSFEPYLDTAVEAGDGFDWQMEYCF